MRNIRILSRLFYFASHVMHHPNPGSRMSQENIETWLIEHVAKRVRLDRRRVNPREPFNTFGIDSVAAVSLIGEMEDWIGHELSPTLMYDYPTIIELAKHLSTDCRQV
jgi:acyl carrier protein